MVSVQDRALRVTESRQKILKPFVLDETLCLYSPQDNVDSLNHPRIFAWNDFIDHRYEPSLPDGRRSIMLFVPCTKTKPYSFSLEHVHINRALLSAGFAPSARSIRPRT
jgi:predicted RNA-binding protein